MNKTRIIIFYLLFFIFYSPVMAATPTASPSATIAPASPSAIQGGPTGPEEEKVLEIRQAIKDQLTEIKEKIEKKAYVGNILEITDSTLTLTNFRGKQRVRIIDDTVIVGTNKKEILTKDLALDDKIIALGEPDANETLEAQRITVIAPPKTIPAKKLIFYGTITEANSKTFTLSFQTFQVKIDKTSYLVNQKDQKVVLKFSDFKVGQKMIIVYPETAEGKIPLSKTVFLLP